MKQFRPEIYTMVWIWITGRGGCHLKKTKHLSKTGSLISGEKQKKSGLLFVDNREFSYQLVPVWRLIERLIRRRMSEENVVIASISLYIRIPTSKQQRMIGPVRAPSIPR